MLPEGCEFKSRTLELEELTGHSRLMRRKVLLRAHFLGFQDDKDPNCHHASPVMPTSCMSSEPALTSCLDSPPATVSPGPRPSLTVWTPLRPRRAQAPRPSLPVWTPLRPQRAQAPHFLSGLPAGHGEPRPPALTSGLDSSPATASAGPRPSLTVWTHLQPWRAQLPWPFSCPWRTASHPWLCSGSYPAELLSPVPHQESRAHSSQLLSLSRHICLVPKSSCSFLLLVLRAPRTFSP